MTPELSRAAAATLPGLHVIVVEDHDLLRQVTVDLLEGMGHHATGLECAEALEDAGGRWPADLLILDINLPGEDGLSVARRVRQAQPDVGIIMVSARTGTTDRVTGYESGADIYIGKPVEATELKAAVQSLARRLQPREAASPGTDRPHALVLERSRLCLAGPAGCVDLAGAEAALLAALARAPGHRLETWQIVELLGEDLDGYRKDALEVRMVRLRRKLQQAGAAEGCLKSIRRWGYQLCCPVTVS